MHPKNIGTLTLYLTLTQSDNQFGCQIHDSNHTPLFIAETTHTYQADAVYTALHGLAVQNNFSVCLKFAEQPE